LISAAALGLAAVLVQWPLLLNLLRWAGAVYIAWLGLGLLRRPAAASDRNTVPAGGFVKALLITLGNPKPLLFFAAFFPLFMEADGRGWLLRFYLLGGLFELLNIASYALLLAMLSRLRGRMPQTAWLARVCGAGLLLSALFSVLA
jgi:leucine efflux protein